MTGRGFAAFAAISLPSVAVSLALCVLLAAVNAAAEVPSIAVVESPGIGVHPASATAAARQTYATVGRLGYRTVPEARVAEAKKKLPPRAPTAADLLEVAKETHAGHALGTEIGAENGKYVVTVTLANADRTGPFVARDAADAETLEPTTDRLIRSLLPPVLDDRARNDGAAGAEEGASPPGGAAGAQGDTKPPSPRLAAQTEAAFGLSRPGFYNHLVGARFDYRFTHRLALGGYLGYVNLKGKEGRTNNVLPYAQLEYRVLGGRAPKLDLPLRFGTGYLPNNGPFLRLSGGFSVPVGDTTRLGFDVLAPTFWIVRDLTVVSLDLAAELTFDL